MIRGDDLGKSLSRYLTNRIEGSIAVKFVNEFLAGKACT
jgi:hypothetical protein